MVIQYGITVILQYGNTAIQQYGHGAILPEGGPRGKDAHKVRTTPKTTITQPSTQPLLKCTTPSKEKLILKKQMPIKKQLLIKMSLKERTLKVII